MGMTRPAPLHALPTGPSFTLIPAPCPAPATYEGCIDLLALPTDACRAAEGEWAYFEAAGDAADALRAAYRAEGRPTGMGYTTEGRYNARCHVSYVGAYRVWQSIPEAKRPEVCE